LGKGILVGDEASDCRGNIVRERESVALQEPQNAAEIDGGEEVLEVDIQNIPLPKVAASIGGNSTMIDKAMNRSMPLVDRVQEWLQALLEIGKTYSRGRNGPEATTALGGQEGPIELGPIAGEGQEAEFPFLGPQEVRKLLA
jgi:hypothetical protein